ncbi:hypothetical protein M0811_01392 [Anaeramoeba ignava]|uniref:BTB domain-containing protein n=1 Tax=Anaeramoeba ignava TaxID=1746090 RepID=A0A9Q0LGL4_ANAIG|nr:hypothetical protein M0811_01392 [Anaeramoeba ignava]
MNSKFFGKHEAEVRYLYINGEFLYSGGFDKKIRIWEISTGKLIKERKTTSYIFCLSVYNNKLVSSGGKISVWNIETLNLEKEFKKDFEGYIFYFVILENFLFTAGGDRIIRKYIFNKGICKKKLTGHSSGVWSLVLNSGFLYSSDSSGEIRCWDIQSLDCQFILKAHNEGIWGIGFFKKFMYSVSNDKKVKIWKFENSYNKQPICDIELTNHTGNIISTFLCDDILFTGAEDNKVVAWNLKKRKFKKTFHFNSKVWNVCSDRKRLFAGLSDHTIEYCDLDDMFPDSLVQDLEKLFKRKENCDLIFQTLDRKISLHSLIIKSRIQIPISKLGDYFAIKPYKITKEFFRWIYTCRTKLKTELNDICQELEIKDFAEKSTFKSLRFSISQLYFENQSKNFNLIVNNKEIPVHKIILQARSELFRGMFVSVEDNSNCVNDYSSRSFESLNALIKFLYFDQLEENLEIKYLNELIDAVDFYQLNKISELNNEIKRIKMKKEK